MFLSFYDPTFLDLLSNKCFVFVGLLDFDKQRQTLIIQILMLKKCPSPKHTSSAMFARATFESHLSRTVTAWNIHYKQGWLSSKMLMSMYSRRLQSSFHSRSLQEKSCQGCLVMKQVLRYLIAPTGRFSGNLCTTKWLGEYATKANCSKTWCEKCTNILNK